MCRVCEVESLFLAEVCRSSKNRRSGVWLLIVSLEIHWSLSWWFVSFPQHCCRGVKLAADMEEGRLEHGLLGTFLLAGEGLVRLQRGCHPSRNLSCDGRRQHMSNHGRGRTMDLNPRPCTHGYKEDSDFGCLLVGFPPCRGSSRDSRDSSVCNACCRLDERGWGSQHICNPSVSIGSDSLTYCSHGKTLLRGLALQAVPCRWHTRMLPHHFSHMVFSPRSFECCFHSPLCLQIDGSNLV